MHILKINFPPGTCIVISMETMVVKHISIGITIIPFVSSPLIVITEFKITLLAGRFSKGKIYES
jgi:hypothetical protein